MFTAISKIMFYFLNKTEIKRIKKLNFHHYQMIQDLSHYEKE